MANPITLADQVPDAFAKRIPQSTTIALSLNCALNITSFSIDGVVLEFLPMENSTNTVDTFELWLP